MTLSAGRGSEQSNYQSFPGAPNAYAMVSVRWLRMSIMSNHIKAIQKNSLRDHFSRFATLATQKKQAGSGVAKKVFNFLPSSECGQL